jgi:ferredoxin
MSSLLVDTQKCTRDELCVAACPVNIIRMNEHGPVWEEWGQRYCLNCGHCVAVCPHGALSLQTMPVEQCPPLRSDWRLSPVQLEQLLKGRRSMRKFTSQPVERDTLARMIDMASFAPSGKNAQPVHWLVINDAAKIARLAELTIEWMRSQVAERSLLARVFGMNGLVTAWDDGDD